MSQSKLRVNVMSGPGSELVSDWFSDSLPPRSDISEGRGDDEGTLEGNDLGTCGNVEKDLAGAKSTSVKTWELKG